jgi:hypothetical protein
MIYYYNVHTFGIDKKNIGLDLSFIDMHPKDQSYIQPISMS